MKGGNVELWRSNGTASGTVKLATLTGAVDASFLGVDKGVTIVMTDSNTISNGSASARLIGDTLVIDIQNGVTTTQAILAALNGLANVDIHATLFAEAGGNTGSGTVGTAPVTLVGPTATSSIAVGEFLGLNLESRLVIGRTFNGLDIRVLSVPPANEFASYDAAQNVLTIGVEDGVTSRAKVADILNRAGLPWSLNTVSEADHTTSAAGLVDLPRGSDIQLSAGAAGASPNNLGVKFIDGLQLSVNYTGGNP